MFPTFKFLFDLGGNIWKQKKFTHLKLQKHAIIAMKMNFKLDIQHTPESLKMQFSVTYSRCKDLKNDPPHSRGSVKQLPQGPRKNSYATG